MEGKKAGKKEGWKEVKKEGMKEGTVNLLLFHHVIKQRNVLANYVQYLGYMLLHQNLLLNEHVQLSVMRNLVF